MLIKPITFIQPDYRLSDLGIHAFNWRMPYDEIIHDINFEYKKNEEMGLELLKNMAEQDFFFFCYAVMGIHYMNHPFIIARCYEYGDKLFENAIYLWAREHFKALAYDTPVLTKRGFVKHGEIKVGDYVVGSNGKFIKVIARTENFENSRQYEITFDNKYKIVASCDHIWEVNIKSKKRVKGEKNKRIGTEKVLKTTDELFEHGSEIDNRLSIDVKFVEYKTIPLEIHPYVLGSWLGDGSSSCGRIHGIDTEVFEKIKNLGYEIVDTSREVTKLIRKIMQLLRKINVLNNKHIPEKYKKASLEQRLELIRGLMDTDGTINDRGTCTFTNINKRLCEDLYDVLVSVGYKPSFRTHLSKINNEPYVFYNVSFNARKEKNPFFLKRKAEKVCFEKKPIRRYITEIKQLKDGEHLTNCIQVEADDGIYLAGKELIPTHNSTVITKCGSIYKEIKRPGRRQAIFSLNATLAKKHMMAIKYECETNPLLPLLWPHIFWEDPRKLTRTEGIIWSQDGINFKTATSAKDLSVSGFGLIDSMPTGGHFTDKNYDDIIDLNNIGTYAMKEKVLYAIQMSDNLGDSITGTVDSIIGTRYDHDDPYEKIIEDYEYPVYKYPSEVDENGEFKIGGIPTLMPREVLDSKLKKQGVLIYSAQMGQSPINFKQRGFKTESFQVCEKIPKGLNYIIICDMAKRPTAASKKTHNKDQDYTVMKVYGFGAGQKNYVCDIVRDRLSLPEKWKELKRMHKTFSPYAVYYESVGAQNDVEYFELKMDEEDYRFIITEIFDNKTTKDKKIEGLSALYDELKIIYLKDIWYQTKFRGIVNLTKEFYDEEYSCYPKVSHDDGLDVDAWLLNEKIKKYYPGESQTISQESGDRHWYRPSPLDDSENTGMDGQWYEF